MANLAALDQINKTLANVKPVTTHQFMDVVTQYDLLGDPLWKDLKTFITLADTACSGNRMTMKREALGHLLKLFPLSSSQAFPNLKVGVVVYQLVLRILKPSRMDQQSFGLCGPAAFAITLAKTKTAEYAKLAVDLLLKGTATCNTLEVKPEKHIREYNPHLTGTIPAADWLVLASLRNSGKALTTSTDLGHWGGTKAGGMFKWLKQAGYGTVVGLNCFQPEGFGATLNKIPGVKSFDDWFSPDYHPAKPPFLKEYANATLTDPKQNLKLAEMFLANGWKVALLITEKLAQSQGDVNPVDKAVNTAKAAFELMEQKPPPGVIEKAEKDAMAQLVGKETNHFAFAKAIDIRENDVRLTLYSWGQKLTTAPYPFELLLKIYGGFVAATELDVTTANSEWKHDDSVPRDNVVALSDLEVA